MNKQLDGIVEFSCRIERTLDILLAASSKGRGDEVEHWVDYLRTIAGAVKDEVADIRLDRKDREKRAQVPPNSGRSKTANPRRGQCVQVPPNSMP